MEKYFLHRFDYWCVNARGMESCTNDDVYPYEVMHLVFTGVGI